MRRRPIDRYASFINGDRFVLSSDATKLFFDTLEYPEHTRFNLRLDTEEKTISIIPDTDGDFKFSINHRTPYGTPDVCSFGFKAGAKFIPPLIPKTRFPVTEDNGGILVIHYQTEEEK